MNNPFRKKKPKPKKGRWEEVPDGYDAFGRDALQQALDDSGWRDQPQDSGSQESESDEQNPYW